MKLIGFKFARLLVLCWVFALGKVETLSDILSVSWSDFSQFIQANHDPMNPHCEAIVSISVISGWDKAITEN